MAPSIYGHEMVKKAIAFAMFGGEPKNPGLFYSTGTAIDEQRLRGLRLVIFSPLLVPRV